jgi:hypothetical protein
MDDKNKYLHNLIVLHLFWNAYLDELLSYWFRILFHKSKESILTGILSCRVGTDESLLHKVGGLMKFQISETMIDMEDESHFKNF